jgi:hypothetical protein
LIKDEAPQQRFEDMQKPSMKYLSDPDRASRDSLAKPLDGDIATVRHR